ncbi:MAG: hypothetical protein ISR69_08050 [Gammaproteobacteria bacterium]|nr:hypothetical protein [Gammaproteobacteria bacterium]
MIELFKIFSLENNNFPHKLLKRAEELSMLEPVILALRYMKKIYGLQYSGDFQNKVNALNPNYFESKWFDFLYLGILIPHHSSCISWRFKIASFFVFWRGHIKKMPFKMLVHHLFKKSFKHLTGLYQDESKVVVKLDDRF